MKRALIVLAVAAACAISFRSQYEADFFWHLAQGREVAAGHLVRSNLFSFSAPDYPQPYTGWLYDLTSYWAWQIGGAPLIQSVQALLIAIALVFVALACRVRSSLTAGFVFATFAWLVIEPRAIPRPHVFSFAALAIISWLIERAYATGRARSLWWSVPLVAVWSNIHVESLFGVAMIAAFAGGEGVRLIGSDRPRVVRLLTIATCATLATLANPYGIGIVRYLYENTDVPSLLNIAELQAPYLPNYRSFFVSAAFAAALVVLRWRSITLWELALVLVFGSLGFRYLRFTPMAVIVSAPIAARGLEDVLTRYIDRRAAIVTMVAATALLSRAPLQALPASIQFGGDALTPRSFFSTAAMQYVRDHGLSGNAYVSNNLGGFVIWSLYPGTRVFQDSRLQAYPAEHFKRMLTAWRSQAEWDAMLNGVDWAILSRPRDNELSGTSRFHAREWAIVFQDEAIEIAVRRTGAFGSLADAPVNR